MIKKIRLAAITVLLSITLTACAAPGGTSPTLVLPWEDTGNTSVSITKEDVDDIKAADYDNDLDGLCAYLKDSYIVAGDPVEMSYAVIDAEGGYKYSFKYRSSELHIELYSFDLEELTQRAETNLKSVRDTGKFTVLETEVSAVISDSGKYIMIYSDSSGSDENKAQEDRAVELFQGFYK